MERITACPSTPELVGLPQTQPRTPPSVIGWRRNGRILLQGNTADLQDGEAIAAAYFGFEEHAKPAVSEAVR